MNNDFPIYLPRLLPKQERFLSGRRSCKGCGKALAARIAAKAVSDTAAIADTLTPGISKRLASLSSHAHAHDSISAAGMIEQFLSTVEDLNADLQPPSRKPVQKAVIGIDRRVLMEDCLTLAQAAGNHQNALYICFDNEPHMQALLNRAIPQPFILNEDHISVTDRDVLQAIQEKNTPAQLASADFPYFATACSSFALDFVAKIKTALDTPGNAFILVLTPCPTDWIFPPAQSLKIGIKAVRSGYFPLYEIREGKVRITERIGKLKPLQEFIGAQKRFMTFPPQFIPVVQNAVTAFYEALLQREGNPSA